ncbi:MAG: DUF4168 domain-containing protein [Elainella sp.]
MRLGWPELGLNVIWLRVIWPKVWSRIWLRVGQIAVRLGTLGSSGRCRVLALELALIWLITLGFATPAIAAEPPSVPANQLELTPEPTRLDADDISAEKIHQFVQAYLQVLALIEGRETELQGAEMEFESQQIQREIEAQAVALIQATGLTLQEYLQLLSFTNIDPEFGERVAAQLQEATQ